MKSEAPKTVDEYLDQVSSETARAALKNIRKILRETLPDAEERISYGMPAFRIKSLNICYAAFKNHCSFFPGYLPEDFADRLKDYKQSKGTIQFDPAHPMPDDLVRDIALAKVERYLAQRK